MAQGKKLKHFSVVESDGGFRIEVEDESGNRLDLTATREQIDVIVDALDDMLAQDDSADEV